MVRGVKKAKAEHDQVVEPALPPWKAFLVQFTRAADPASGIFTGRVEHLASGQRAGFTSTGELLAIMMHLLDRLAPQTRHSS